MKKTPRMRERANWQTQWPIVSHLLLTSEVNLIPLSFNLLRSVYHTQAFAIVPRKRRVYICPPIFPWDLWKFCHSSFNLTHIRVMQSTSQRTPYRTIEFFQSSVISQNTRCDSATTRHFHLTQVYILPIPPVLKILSKPRRLISNNDIGAPCASLSWVLKWQM